MYLNKIIMKHFQVHENTEITFKDGINVIVGSTDSGKSSIWRGLRAILMNDIKLMKKITKNVKKPKCELELIGEFGSVKRTRSKSKNLYQIDNKELKAFGQGPVEEVLKYTNITDINFQSQHDKAFLISESSGEVAKYLNRIINLEVIDSTLSNLKSCEGEASRDAKRYEVDCNEKQKELESFDGFEAMDEAMSEIEDLEKQLEEVKAEIKDLNPLHERLDEAEFVLETLDEAEFDKFEQLTSLIKKIAAEADLIRELNELIENLEQADEDLEDLEEIYVLCEDLEAIENLSFEIAELQEATDALQDIFESDNCDSVLEELETELKKISKVCPTCGQLMGEAK